MFGFNSSGNQEWWWTSVWVFMVEIYRDVTGNILFAPDKRQTTNITGSKNPYTPPISGGWCHIHRLQQPFSFSCPRHQHLGEFQRKGSGVHQEPALSTGKKSGISRPGLWVIKNVWYHNVTFWRSGFGEPLTPSSYSPWWQILGITAFSWFGPILVINVSTDTSFTPAQPCIRSSQYIYWKSLGLWWYLLFHVLKQWLEWAKYAHSAHNWAINSMRLPCKWWYFSLNNTIYFTFDGSRLLFESWWCKNRFSSLWGTIVTTNESHT